MRKEVVGPYAAPKKQTPNGRISLRRLTALEMAEFMPRGVRTLYIQNTSVDELSTRSFFPLTFVTPGNALVQAFDWKTSPQGFSFWEKVYLSLS